MPMITGHAEGTGLGLSIAQSLVQQHSGLIEFTSEPDKTIFTILLPINTQYWSRHMTVQSHVWIIDDDDSIRWVLQKALEGADFIVTSFDNANTILHKLKQE